MSHFFVFFLISGVGWLCDFFTYALIVGLTKAPSFAANFVSSYVGVTFVWLTSLKTVFVRDDLVRSRYLFFYWGYQFISIFTYSKILQLAGGLIHFDSLPFLMFFSTEVAGKVVITPFNLLTNFVFMKLIVSQMHRKEPENA